MAYPKKEQFVPMSAVEATHLVRKMIHRKSSRPGDAERVMKQIATDYTIGFWTLDHLRKGKAKTCDIGLFSRIKAAYLDISERQVAKLIHEIALEKAMNPHDYLEDFEAEAEALAARIQAKRKALR